jgi:hypothetical protein
VARKEVKGGGGEWEEVADSSGSKVICACGETKKEEKLKGNKWPERKTENLLRLDA